jgi:hypothetical protein
MRSYARVAVEQAMAQSRGYYNTICIVREAMGLPRESPNDGNDLLAALAQQAVRQEPVAWIEYVDGNKTQNVARDSDEKTMMDRIVRACNPGCEVTWEPLYTAPIAQPVVPEELYEARELLFKLSEHITVHSDGAGCYELSDKAYNLASRISEMTPLKIAAAPAQKE